MPLLLASSPIFPWVATSGGIDLLGAVSTVGFVYALSSYWKNPDQARFLALILIGAFAAYTRYEVIGIVLPGIFLCLAKDWKNGRLKKTIPALGLFFLFLLPLLAQLSVARSSFVETGGLPLVSFQHMEKNLTPFLLGFFQPMYARPFAAPLFLLGLISFLFSLFRGRAGFFPLCFAAAALFQLLLVLCYFAGHSLDPVSARLYLLPAIALSLAPLLLVGDLAGKKRALLSWIVFGLALTSYFFSMDPLRGNRELFPPSIENKVKADLDAYFEAQPLSPSSTLYISNLSFITVSQGMPSVSPAFFLEKENLFREKLQRGEIREIVWLRSAADDPWKLAAASELALEKLGDWVNLQQKISFPELRFLKWVPGK